MYIKKDIGIKIISFAAAAVLTAVGFVISNRAAAEEFRKELTVSSGMVMSNISDYYEKLSNSLTKAKYSSTQSFMAASLCEVWRYSGSVAESLSMLPAGDESVETLSAFAARTGDYSFTLLKKILNGGELSEEDMENLKELEARSQTLYLSFAELEKKISGGEVSVHELSKAFNEEKNAPSFSDNAKEISDSIAGAPSLIYDGPFSEHLEDVESVFLKSQKELSEGELRAKAAEILGVPASSLGEPVRSDTSIPSYWFSGGGCSVELTVRGGFIKSYLQDGAELPDSEKKNSGSSSQDGINDSVKASAESAKDYENGVEKALGFLEKMGFSDMKESYYYCENGILTVNFAYRDGDVICYPDLIKVAVSMKDMSVVSMDSAGYLVNHREDRELDPSLSDSEVLERISPDMQVKKVSTAVIPTAGKHEVLTVEVLLEASDGTEILSYFNGETGNEEQILILLKSDNGILTV